MEDFEMHAMRVGDRICKPSGDGIIFELTDTGAVLLLKFRNPTAKEKRNITKDLPQFKLAIVDDIIFVLVRFGVGCWMDAPYNARLTSYVLPCPGKGEGLAMTILFVDAATGTLLHIRLIGLSNAFSRLLLHAAAQQPDLGTPEQYDRTLKSVYDRYSTNDLLNFVVELEE